MCLLHEFQLSPSQKYSRNFQMFYECQFLRKVLLELTDFVLTTMETVVEKM